MRRIKKTVILFALAVYLPVISIGQTWTPLSYQPHETRSRWSVEYHFGAVSNLKLPLTFVQRGYPDIHIAKADIYSEPFTSPHYWDMRLVKWFKKDGISLELIHHKIYLRNAPPEVKRFTISHGYNIFLLSYNRNFKWFNIAAGGGTVMMHPESTIRGKVWSEGDGSNWSGYLLNGIALNLAVSHQVRIYKRFYLNLEGKVIYSKANVPIVDGYAKFNNVAFQLIFGPGIDWGYSKKYNAMK